MTVERQLAAADAPALEAFLAVHRDSSMFLRSNLRRAGLTWAGAPYEAQYFGAIRDGLVIGVVAHGWNGMVLVQAPGHAASLAHAVVQLSGRRVAGFTGPAAQVRQARSALGLDGAATEMDEDEGLYALELSGLVVPQPLTSGAVVCRPPRADERDMLCAWRLAYNIEALGASDTPEQWQRSAQFLDAQMAAGNAWVALVDEELVSLSAFNAALPDIVQIGGVYTPPDLRGRGYAKAAVAASLRVAVGRGASRAVLFASNPAAVRTYAALGFRRIGEYGLILMR